MSDDNGRFQDGNTAALKHGAYSYLRRLEDGRPLTEHMLETRREVDAKYAQLGPRGMLEEDAKDLETHALLLLYGMMTSPDEFTKLSQRWLTAKLGAARLWDRLAALPTDEPLGAAEILASYRTGDNDNGNG